MRTEMTKEKFDNQSLKKRRFTLLKWCLGVLLILGLLSAIPAYVVWIFARTSHEATVGTGDWEFAVKRVLHLNEAPRLDGGHVVRMILGESTYRVWVYGDPTEIRKLIPNGIEALIDDERPTQFEPVPEPVATRVKLVDFAGAKSRLMRFREEKSVQTTRVWFNANGDAAYIMSQSWPDYD